MHDHQVIGAKILPFPLGGRHNRCPGRLRDALALLPLGDRPVTFANRISEFGDGSKGLNKLYDGGFHTQDIAGDGLSRQVQSIIPVTKESHRRTMRPMGRHSPSSQFKAEMAKLLKAARISAGFDTQREFAFALGIQEERYKKWESGRTPIPHEYMPGVCELLDKDANYFYKLQPRPLRKTA